MPMLVAEELNVDLSKVNVDFAPPAKFILTSRWSNYWWFYCRDALGKLRKAGASARMMLVAAAAYKLVWMPASVLLKTEWLWARKKATMVNYEKAYLWKFLKKLLSSQAEWKYIGNTKQRLDTQMKVTGTVGFGIDTKVPGMLYAAVHMAPQQGGMLQIMTILELKNAWC